MHFLESLEAGEGEGEEEENRSGPEEEIEHQIGVQTMAEEEVGAANILFGGWTSDVADLNDFLAHH